MCVGEIFANDWNLVYTASFSLLCDDKGVSEMKERAKITTFLAPGSYKTWNYIERLRIIAKYRVIIQSILILLLSSLSKKR